MLDAYRSWLESELKLLGNASHHAYSFGQANMAKRALERLNEELAGKLAVAFERPDVLAALTALSGLEERQTALDPALARLRERLQSALEEEQLP